MKNTALAFTLLALVSCAKEKSPEQPPHHHLDLEMTTQEYRKLLAETPSTGLPVEITTALSLGERAMLWMNKVNAGRKERGEAVLALTTQAQYQSSPGIPIEKPSISNVDLLRTRTETALKNLPEVLKATVQSTNELPGDLSGMDDATFIKHARVLNSLYQMAARLKLLLPYKAWYTKAQYKDVRGYWYLKKENITSETLKDLSAVEAEKAKLIRQALLRICLNSQAPLADCKAELATSEEARTLPEFYEKYIAGAKTMWTNFFDLPETAARKDLSWANNELTVPFNSTTERLESYLKMNIEDEFKFKEWKLLLTFGTFPGSAELQFQKGVTPHVNKLGGNYIIMDENESIDEYSSKWVIRHEFGHVLGLPDCYHEFYDEEQGAFVNYQLDVSDLMCSRAGKMNERIFKELEKHYDSASKE